MSNELTVLKWAAGLPVVPPPVGDCDRDLLLALLWQHKLTGRLLARVQDGWPGCSDSRPTDFVVEQQDEVERSLAERRSVLTEIGAAIAGSGDQELLIVKGFTSYFLTGDTSFLRRSNDVDLLWRDPAGLVSLLDDLGYEKADDHCRGHEYMALYRCGVKVDVHGYFPVESSAEAPDPEFSEGGLVRTGRFTESAITYQRMLLGSRPSGLPGVRIVGPEMAVLIAVAHVFREYAHQPFLLPFGTVRMGELLEIDALVRWPGFDAARFVTLCEEYLAALSVDFVNSLLTRFLGREPIPGGSAAPVSRYPYDLWLDGFVIGDDRAQDTDALFMRPHGMTMADVVRGFGGAATGRTLRYAATDGLAAPVPPCRLSYGEAPAVTLQAWWGEANLTVRVEWYGQPEAGRERYVMINTGDILHEIFWPARGRDQARLSWQRNNAAGRQWRYPLRLSATEDRIEIQIPASALDGADATGARPLLLGVRPAAGPSLTEGGTVVPMTLRP